MTTTPPLVASVRAEAGCDSGTVAVGEGTTATGLSASVVQFEPSGSARITTYALECSAGASARMRTTTAEESQENSLQTSLTFPVIDEVCACFQTLPPSLV